jgi:hypothetical protein
MSTVLTFVCLLAFEICLFTDTPQGGGNIFLRWLTIVKDKLLEIWNYIKRKVVGLWNDVEEIVKKACGCINSKCGCGCCAHIETKKIIKLNNTSKIVVVTEHLLPYIKVLYDVWCD